MSVLCFDGFSHYQTSDILRKWTALNPLNSTWTITAEGRTANCIKKQCTLNGDNGFITRTPTVRQSAPWTPQTGGICGFALKIDDLARVDPTFSTGGPTNWRGGLLQVWNGSNPMFAVTVNANGTLALQLFGVAGLSAVSVGGLTSGSWSYIEIKWNISPTTGSLIIRANGIEIMNYSGVLFPTTFPNPAPTAFWNSVNWLALKSTTAPYLLLRACDFYLSDWVAPNGDFLGDVTISYVVPDANGAPVNWTPSAGTNFSNVNEAPPTDDAAYNSATPPGTLDLYSFQPIVVNPIAIQHCVLARRTLPGSATIQAVAKLAGTNYSSPAQAVQDETYKYCLYPYDTNPATGNRFTSAEFNAGEFGPNKDT